MRLLPAFILTLLVLACGVVPDWNGDEPSAPGAQPDQPVSSERSHLRVAGTSFVDADGKPFAWRGVSAFRLLEMIAHGRESDAAAYLDWAASRQLSVVRVFTMARHLFQLTPEEGRAALPKLLELAASRKLYVEAVALVDTAVIPVDIHEHISAIGAIAARHPNTVVEIANEPVHPTQRLDVHSADVLRKAAAAIPSGVPVSLGSIERGEGFGAGTYLTWHVPRTSEPGGWGHVVGIAEGAALIHRFRKPVVSDEPVGAADVFIAGRRDNEPARFRAAALFTRLAGLGATFHYEGGLQARIPQGRELECLDAWSEAWKLLPADVERRGSFARAGEEGAVVAAFDRRAAAAVYERHTDREAWVVAVGVTRDPRFRLSERWRIERSEEFPGAWLVTLTRE